MVDRDTPKYRLARMLLTGQVQCYYEMDHCCRASPGLQRRTAVIIAADRVLATENKTELALSCEGKLAPIVSTGFYQVSEDATEMTASASPYVMLANQQWMHLDRLTTNGCGRWSDEAFCDRYSSSGVKPVNHQYY
ncbi:hypothetical protein LSH36_18g11043 [Paralvinella palmiformis]|uniref:Uncharacterized protein n=1 Tax=Paralvinella palmiformis TaxID=53620 RepID=A0AAD9KCT4_9ANNE|nr:hypothetical protein LSH36_18g11043 [Paralvinella palmiformis]